MSDSPFHKPITGMKTVQPRDGMDVVVLERIEPGVTPEYCIHGKTTCYGCNEWCWLGDKTHEVMMAGNTLGMCLQCADKMLPKQHPREHVHDHRRADGPHT